MIKYIYNDGTHLNPNRGRVCTIWYTFETDSNYCLVQFEDKKYDVANKANLIEVKDEQ